MALPFLARPSFAAMLLLARVPGAGAQAQPAPAAAPATPAGAAPARVSGTVYDSLARQPLGGAVVQLVAAADPARTRSTTSDSLGRYAFDGVAPGRYLTGFFHPALDRLGVELAPTAFDLQAGVAREVPLALPGPALVRRALCGPRAADARDSTGVLVGFVHDADGGGPLDSATVVLTWSELVLGGPGGVRTERRRVPAPVRAGGTYLVCGVPVDGPLTAGAEAPGRASGLVEVSVASRGVLVQDFALGDSLSARAVADTAAGDSSAPRLARGTARLTGVVLAARGAPARGARVTVWGTGVTAVTNDSGAFRMAGLPAGTYSVEARAIGREPRRAPVALASGRAATVRLTLDAPVRTLERVTVIGKRSRRTRDFDGFLDRRRTGFGRYLTAADIERRAPLYLSDALRTVVGVRVVSGASGGYAIRGRGGCVPGVVLDGMPIMNGADDLDNLVRPQQVMGVEVYLGIGGLPAQFGGYQNNACGTVAVWTTR